MHTTNNGTDHAYQRQTQNSFLHFLSLIGTVMDLTKLNIQIYINMAVILIIGTTTYE